jgi:hypothetical protein
VEINQFLRPGNNFVWITQTNWLVSVRGNCRFFWDLFLTQMQCGQTVECLSVIGGGRFSFHCTYTVRIVELHVPWHANLNYELVYRLGIGAREYFDVLLWWESYRTGRKMTLLQLSRNNCPLFGECSWPAQRELSPLTLATTVRGKRRNHVKTSPYHCMTFCPLVAIC